MQKKVLKDDPTFKNVSFHTSLLHLLDNSDDKLVLFLTPCTGHYYSKTCYI